MTLEELKAEAARQGYHLIRNSDREKLLPCVCGHNRREYWYTGDGGVRLVCKGCGREVKGKTEREAIRNWNEAVRKGTT